MSVQDEDGTLLLEKLSLRDLTSDPHLLGRSFKQMLQNEEFVKLVDRLEEALVSTGLFSYFRFLLFSFC